MVKKNSGINLRKESEPTISEKPTEQEKSGAGLTASLGEYGDYEVKAVAEVDISPLDFDVNYDTSSNELGASGEIGLPGGIVGIGGGVTVDLDTGEVSSISGSIGLGGYDVEVSFGNCESTLQVTYFGLGFSLSKDTCSSDDDKKEEPSDPSNPPNNPPQPPQPNASDFPSTEGFLVFQMYAPIRNWTVWLDAGQDLSGSYTEGYSISINRSYSLPLSFSEGETITYTYSSNVNGFGSGECSKNYTPVSSSEYIEIPYDVLNLLKTNNPAVRQTFNYPGGRYRVIRDYQQLDIYWVTDIRKYIEWVSIIKVNEIYVLDNYNFGSASPSICGKNSRSINFRESKLVGYIPIVPVYVDISSKLRRPIPPNMNNNDECCRANLALLRRIAKSLETDKMLDDGLTLPIELFTPEGGTKTIKLTSYMQLFNILFRTLDHRTMGQIDINILDNNKVKEGNQSVQLRTINASGYYKALFETLLESKGESGDQLQILVRMMWSLTQLTKLAVVINENTKVLIEYFAVPFKELISKVTVPFDISLGGKLSKGFGAKDEPSDKEILKVLEQDTEEAAESILSKLMNVWQMPVKVKKFSKGGNFWFFNKNNK